IHNHSLHDALPISAEEIRHAFKKNNGNLGETGCVSFMFERKGYFLILNEDDQIDEDTVTLDALEAGADDIEVHDGAYEIYTAPDQYDDVLKHLEEAGYAFEQNEITLIPNNEQAVSEEA